MFGFIALFVVGIFFCPPNTVFAIFDFMAERSSSPLPRTRPCTHARTHARTLPSANLSALLRVAPAVKLTANGTKVGGMSADSGIRT